MKLKQFVPPILWGAARSFARRQRGPIAPAPMATRSEYKVAFRSVRLGGFEHFVPAYALHRPAVMATLRGQVFERETHAFVARLMSVKPGSMIHAGTFFGDMLPSFSHACPGTLHAFEPVLENYVLAKLSIEANRLENVVLLNCGLGATIAQARIATTDAADEHLGGASSIGATGQITALMPIDAFAIHGLSLLQLDVEGFELEALRGAEATIERERPVIMIEDNSGNCPDFLAGKGYVFAGAVPELTIWSMPADAELVRAILKEI